jgi:1,2-diacylglycerol 3-beta-galactosyltransferase
LEPETARRTLDFVFFDAGGGHRSAATALKAVIEQQQRPWNVRLVNLQEVLDSLDVFRKLTGVRLEDIYNRMLAHGWTYGSAQSLKVMHAIIRLYHGAQVKVLARHWAETRPDLVVSLVPNFNRAMFEGLRRANPAAPYVTILTDLADWPPHFWIERQPQYFICGTDRAVEQARALGHPDRRILRASGMILRPNFYDPLEVDRAEERVKLGLDPEKPTGMVLFGGAGSAVMTEIAGRLDRSGLDVQLVLICGRNERLAAKLRALPKRIPMRVEGFTKEIPYFMHLSDFFIGKPGPGSISEALQMKLPVIVERNSFTLPQERYNAQWVEEQGVGMVLPNFRRIDAAVGRMLEPQAFARYRIRAAGYTNRAVFEIPEMLDRILAGAHC